MVGACLPRDVSCLVPEPALEFPPSQARPHRGQSVEGVLRGVLFLLLRRLRLPPVAPPSLARLLLPLPPGLAGAPESARKLVEGDGAVAVGVQALKDRLHLGRTHPQLGAKRAEVVALDPAGALYVAGQEKRAEPGQLVQVQATARVAALGGAHAKPRRDPDPAPAPAPWERRRRQPGPNVPADFAVGPSGAAPCSTPRPKKNFVLPGRLKPALYVYLCERLPEPRLVITSVLPTYEAAWGLAWLFAFCSQPNPAGQACVLGLSWGG